MDNRKDATDLQLSKDPISNVLKWVLLITAVLCFAAVGFGTYKTYQLAPPMPEQFLAPAGQVVMTAEDVIAGKAGFQ